MIFLALRQCYSTASSSAVKRRAAVSVNAVLRHHGKPRFFKGVTPELNAKLIAYQRELREARLRFRREFAGLLTGAQARAAHKAKMAKERLVKWRNYLSELRNQLMRPDAPINRDRHACRPVVRHHKTSAYRKQAVINLSQALAVAQERRRKHLALLAQQVAAVNGEYAFLGPDNLDAAIDKALANPTNFRMAPSLMIRSELKVRTQIKKIQVPVDRRIYAVNPQATITEQMTPKKIIATKSAAKSALKSTNNLKTTIANSAVTPNTKSKTKSISQ